MDSLMTTHTRHRWFQDLIEAEGMSDVRRFLQRDFFDEIPFYSRYKQLPDAGFEDVAGLDRQLIESCLNYLNELLLAHVASEPLFAAITVIRQGRNQPILPSLFVCHGASVAYALEHLTLTPSTTKFGVELRRLLQTLNLDARFGILQDSMTTPGHSRFFLLPKIDPASKTVCINHLIARSSAPDQGHRPVSNGSTKRSS